MSKAETPGPLSNEPMVEILKTFCIWQTKLYTIVELHEKFRTFAENDDLYSSKCLKKDWKNIKEIPDFFAKIPGLSNTICFKDMAIDLLNDKWYQDRKCNLEE